MANQGKTIVYITHDIHEIIHLCNRIGVMHEGRIRFIGTLGDAKEELNQEMEGSDLTAEEVVYHLLNGV